MRSTDLFIFSYEISPHLTDFFKRSINLSNFAISALLHKITGIPIISAPAEIANLTASYSSKFSDIAFMFIASLIITPLNPICFLKRSVNIIFDKVAGIKNFFHLF